MFMMTSSLVRRLDKADSSKDEEHIDSHANAIRQPEAKMMIKAEQRKI